MIYTHKEIIGPKTFTCDVCIIGTGAGGAAAAYKLAASGKKVVVLERGDFLTPKDFSQKEEDMFPKLFIDGGARRSVNKSIRVIHGQGVGGSTLHNINLCKTLPHEILEKWNIKGLDQEKLQPYFEEVKRDLNIQYLTEDQVNNNNQILKKGVTNLGYRGSYLQHNRQGCLESGFCELGCSYNAKMNALRVYIPRIVKLGGTILANTKATRLIHDGASVTGVEAQVRSNNSDKFVPIKILSKHTVLSAGAIESPVLLLKSHVPDPYQFIGQQLYLHPGFAVCGLFEEKIQFWKGIPQSYECTEFLSFDENDHEKKRVWLISGSAHPIGAAGLIPSFAQEHLNLMKNYPHLGVITPMLHDISCGKVKLGRQDSVEIHYELNNEDRQQMQKGILESARLLFAGGASEVIIPTKTPLRFTKFNEMEIFEKVGEQLHQDFGADLISVHPMSTLWMGDHSKNSCTNSKGHYHHLKNLSVADTSLFPTSIGVPPQWSTYAFGLYVGEEVSKLLN